MASFVALIFLAGCATSQPDWKNRIGSYSYDQAIVDMGPPDNAMNFADGTVIAKWYSSRRVSFGFGAGASNGGAGGGISGPIGDEMRVTQFRFGPDGILESVTGD